MPRTSFHNMSDSQLADAIGEVKTVLGPAKQRYDALKAEFHKRDLTQARGEQFDVTAVKKSREGGLDKALICEEMGVGWINQHLKSDIVYFELSVTEAPKVKAPRRRRKVVA